jgi:hypothetical protein
MTKVPSPEGLRYDYESTLLSLATLEAKYGLSRGEITARRIAEKWTPRASNVAALKAYRLAAIVQRLEVKSAPVSDGGVNAPAPADPAQASQQPAAKPKRATAKSGGTLKHRKSLIMRLYDLFDDKLGEIEERVATHTPLARPDNESEVRMFGQFIKYFESLTDLSDAELKSIHAASDVTHDDAERHRQNLVERIEKLRSSADPNAPAAARAD